MADQYTCLTCQKAVTATKNLRYRSHTNQDGEPCPESSDPICKRELDAGPLPEDNDGAPIEGRDYARCHLCKRHPEIDREGRLQEHLGKGKAKCPSGGKRPVPTTAKASTVAVEKTPEPDKTRSPEPPDTSKSSRSSSTNPPSVSTSTPTEPSADSPVDSTPAPTSTTSGTPSLTGPTSPNLSSSPLSTPLTDGSTTEGPFPFAPRISELFLQPLSPFLQPFVIPPKIKVEMTDKGRDIATRLKEIFYSYDNRKTSDNRSAQVTLGPSEVGTPCERRLGMSLMRIPAVNPGGDGWAAFVGTCVHEGLQQVFTWADAGTGRFATELPLSFPSAYVPRGTGDLLDRVLLLFLDHKAMGEYSLKRLREKGPSDTYRIQVHLYAYGAILAGERVKDVAIVGWPRAGANLDQLFVWTEPYDRKVAEAALKRVDKLAGTLPLAGAITQQMTVARSLPMADKYECRFCPFHLKGDKDMAKGCPGPA